MKPALESKFNFRVGALSIIAVIDLKLNSLYYWGFFFLIFERKKFYLQTILQVKTKL